MTIKIIFLIFLNLWVFNSNSALKEPKVVNGTIDFTNYDLEKKQSVKLSGEWKFFWKKFIKPNSLDTLNLKDQGGLLKVPGSWMAFKGQKTQPQGYGTYILKIKGLKKGQELGLIVGRVFSNYSLYLVQKGKVKKIFSSGVTGVSKDKSVPQLLKGKTSFTAEGEEIEIVLHVSNYYYREGKIFLDFEIGHKNKIFREFSKIEYRKFFFVGCLFILCLYHIAIFLKRPTNKQPLFFSLFCGFILTRQMTVAHDLFWILGNPSLFSFELNAKLDYFTLIYSFPVFVSFINSLYPSNPNMGTFHKYIYIPPLLFTPIILFFPAEFFSQTYFLVAAQIFILVGCTILFVISFQLAYRKYEFARILFISINFLIFGAVYDILIQQGFLPAPEILAPMLVLFSFAQSYIISVNFSNAFNESEKLSSELSDLNKDLDVKVQKRTSQLKKIQEERSLFFSKLSHELKTPLNVILGFSNFIMDGMRESYSERDKKKYLDCLESIRSSGNSLLSLVNEFHDFTKLDLSRLKIVKKPMDLSTSLKNISTFYFHKCQEKGITFSLVHQPMDYLIFFDELRLKQVLNNFLTNALKFTIKGNVYLTCNYVFSDKNEQTVDLHISIKDTGRGIREDKISNLFDTFSQTHEQNTIEERGTGLGLHVSKKIIDVMEGTVEVESIFGKGTQFDIYFPKVEIIKEEKNNKEVNKSYKFFGDTVIVADDFPANISLLETFFSDKNLKIINAESGEELYEKAIEHNPSLIITDFYMSKGDGLSTKDDIKNNEKTKDIPIILLTAFQIDSETQKEFDAVLFKPIEKNKIIETCAKFLKNESYEENKQSENTIDNINFNISSKCGEAELSILKVIKETFERSLELQNITDLEAFCNGLKEQLPNTELKNVISWIDKLSLEAEEFDIEKINTHLKEAIKEIDHYLEKK